ncbi:MAG TPA: copper transporter [Syntrophomonadaceae bacterium]|nr:copper transporter [Syntrophomonadaceae bacterium]
MIDLRYHITSIVAVFLALGLGVLIGSTIVGNNVLVDQQKKMIDSLDQQFYSLRERENDLVAEDNFKQTVINNYENFSQTLQPLLLKDRLANFKVAVVVSGDSEIPAGMLNALSLSGASVVSNTVLLPGMSFGDASLREQVAKYYQMDAQSAPDILRHRIAEDVAATIANSGDQTNLAMLQKKNLVKYSGETKTPADAVILVGGVNNLANFFAQSFDQGLVDGLNQKGLRVFGVENSTANYSYMEEYQKNNISTVDNIEMSPGQLSLIFSLAGEPGNYGVRTTAKKFMPSLPVHAIKGT